MNQRLIHCVWLAILVGGASVKAQDIRCTASVESAVIEAGTAFTLTVQVTGADVADIEQPVLPGMKGIEVLYNNAGVSTSIQIINGQRSETKSFQYLLRAKEPGRWQIPALHASFRGRKFDTQPLNIEVVPLGKISGITAPGEASGDVFLALVPSKKQAYVGEQILIQLKIYTRVTVSQYSPNKMPNFTGFWVEDFPLKQPLESEREQVGGVMYNSFTIRRSAIFATRPGQLTIEPADVECELRIPRKNRGGRLDDFFSPFADPLGQTVVKVFQSAPVEIQVKELPTGGKPAGFSGLVGNFDRKTSLDKSKMKTGEALVYTIEISGIGNIHAAEIPPNPFPDDFERYEPKVSTEISKNGNVISGRKTIEYVVVPRSARVFEIAATPFTYFDPIQKKYITREGTLQTVTIEQGSMSAVNNLSREEIAMISRDIRFIKTNPGRWNDGGLKTWWLGLLWVAPVMVLTVVYVQARRRAIQRQNKTYWHYRKASPTALKRLKMAEKLASQNRTDSFYGEISRTLVGFVTDKLRLKNALFVRDEVIRLMRQRHVTQEVIDEFILCLESCDAARYSPDRESPLMIDETLQLVKKTILSIDRQL